MKKHRIKRCAARLLWAALCFCTLFAPLSSAYSETPAEKLERLRQEQKGIEAGISRAQQDKAQAQQTKQYYLELSNNLKAQLTALREDIEAQRQSIERKNDEAAAMAANAERERALFEERLRGMYEMSRQSSLAMLLGVGDVSQLLRFVENLQRITVHDTELVKALQAREAALEEQRAELERQFSALSAREQELTDTAAAYALAIRNADDAITAAEAGRLASEEALAEKRRQIEQAEKEWQEWARAEQVDFSFGGVFDWPLPGYTRVSSGFQDVRDVWGNGGTDVHRGLDIPAPKGTKIYAAADGVVSTTLHVSYGTAVKLSHGDEVVTIYAHMSARAVQDGDIVQKGQLIGYVGMTGNARGYHLHFEVDINGTPVDPWPYLKGA